MEQLAGELLLGRSAQADIRIDHGSVSREHARLHLGDTLLIEDLASANGTRLRVANEASRSSSAA